jgi:hypothetical protein
MEIYELRKTKSKNKKYKYIYQLMVDNEVVFTRKSNCEYIGANVVVTPIKGGKTYVCNRFFTTDTVLQFTRISKAENSSCAIIFTALKNLRET